MHINSYDSWYKNRVLGIKIAFWYENRVLVLKSRFGIKIAFLNVKNVSRVIFLKKKKKKSNHVIGCIDGVICY